MMGWIQMKEYERAELIARVMEMEQYLDEILAAKERNPDCILEDMEIKTKFECLIAYYENRQWLRDYESDERGELPRELKRGVLSEDAVYNLLMEIELQE